MDLVFLTGLVSHIEVMLEEPGLRRWFERLGRDRPGGAGGPARVGAVGPAHRPAVARGGGRRRGRRPGRRGQRPRRRCRPTRAAARWRSRSAACTRSARWPWCSTPRWSARCRTSRAATSGPTRRRSAGGASTSSSRPGGRAPTPRSWRPSAAGDPTLRAWLARMERLSMTPGGRRAAGAQRRRRRRPPAAAEPARPDARPAPHRRPAHRRAPLALPGRARPGRALRRGPRARQPADDRGHRGAARRDRGVPDRRPRLGRRPRAADGPVHRRRRRDPARGGDGGRPLARPALQPRRGRPDRRRALRRPRGQDDRRRLPRDVRGPAVAGACAARGRSTAGVRALGLEVRCGLHTGECEHLGEDVGGMAVHIAARVCALAAPGEVLASGHRLRDRRRDRGWSGRIAAASTCAASPGSGRCSPWPDNGPPRPQHRAHGATFRERRGCRGRRAIPPGRRSCRRACPSPESLGVPTPMRKFSPIDREVAAGHVARPGPRHPGLRPRRGRRQPAQGRRPQPRRQPVPGADQGDRDHRQQRRPTARGSPTSPTSAAARSTAAAPSPAAGTAKPCVRANNLSNGLRVPVRVQRPARRHHQRHRRRQRQAVHHERHGRRDRPERRPRRLAVGRPDLRRGRQGRDGRGHRRDALRGGRGQRRPRRQARRRLGGRTPPPAPTRSCSTRTPRPAS